MILGKKAKQEAEKKLRIDSRMPIPLQDTTERLPTFTAYLLSRRITFITIPELIKVIRRTCLEGKKMIVASYNINSFNLSMHLPWFYDFLQSAEIARCDGFGILKAFQYMGLSLSQKYRASGTVLVPSLLEQLKSEDFSFFLLGSKPQYIEKALTRIREQYPTLRVEGHHGYFDKEDYYQNEAVVQYINRVKPNILIVGMGMPTQERWIQRHRHLLDVNVILPSGAVIDRLAGIVPDCPKVISDIGCEWLYRLCREPRRLAARYLIGNFAFGLQVALAKHSHTSSLHVEQKEIIGSQSF